MWDVKLGMEYGVTGETRETRGRARRGFEGRGQMTDGRRQTTDDSK